MWNKRVREEWGRQGETGTGAGTVGWHTMLAIIHGCKLKERERGATYLPRRSQRSRRADTQCDRIGCRDRCAPWTQRCWAGARSPPRCRCLYCREVSENKTLLMHQLCVCVCGWGEFELFGRKTKAFKLIFFSMHTINRWNGLGEWPDEVPCLGIGNSLCCMLHAANAAKHLRNSRSSR